MKEYLKNLDDEILNFSPEVLFVINLALAFIMFGVALGIKFEHFRKIGKNPKSVITGFISQFLLLPLLTFILCILMSGFITSTIALGMILVASCPGGNISNFISSLAKSNTALSVTLTAIATLSAILLTPLNFALWGKLFVMVSAKTGDGDLVRHLEINVGEMFFVVFILLGIPLLLGMLFSWKFPKTSDIISRPIRILSVIFFMCIVVLAFRNNFDSFMICIKYIFFIVLIHNAIALISGYLFAHVLRRNREDKRAISIETGIQNSGLALILLFNDTIFPEPDKIGGMTIIAAWWGIWHILSGLGIAALWSFRSVKD